MQNSEYHDLPIFVTPARPTANCSPLTSVIYKRFMPYRYLNASGRTLIAWKSISFAHSSNRRRWITTSTTCSEQALLSWQSPEQSKVTYYHAITTVLLPASPSPYHIRRSGEQSIGGHVWESSLLFCSPNCPSISFLTISRWDLAFSDMEEQN